MMDVVLGSTYRAKGVLKYVLAQAAGKVKASLGLRVKTVSSDKPYFVKDTYYVINALVSALFLVESLVCSALQLTL